MIPMAGRRPIDVKQVVFPRRLTSLQPQGLTLAQSSADPQTLTRGVTSGSSIRATMLAGRKWTPPRPAKTTRLRGVQTWFTLRCRGGW